MTILETLDHEERGRSRQAWMAVIIGAMTFWIATFATFVAVGDDWWTGTASERAAVIDDNLAAWRATWAITMPAELLVGVGLILVGRILADREVGSRRRGWQFVGLVGLAHLPIAIARFGVSLGDGAFAVDPGVWFDVLWGIHFFGLVAGCLTLGWLGYRRLAPRWACIVTVLFALIAVPQLAPSPAYFPALAVFAIAARRRMRSAEPSEVLAPVAA